MNHNGSSVDPWKVWSVGQNILEFNIQLNILWSYAKSVQNLNPVRSHLTLWEPIESSQIKPTKRNLLNIYYLRDFYFFCVEIHVSNSSSKALMGLPKFIW